MRSSIWWFAVLGVVGCGGDGDHPPVQSCGAQCRGGPVLGGGASTGNGSGGEAGSGDSAPVFSVTRFESDDFVTTAPFNEPATVLADGERGVTLEATWNGVDPFAIEDLAREPFFLVEPEAGVDALPTLLAPRLRSPVELPLVRTTVVESILSLSSLPLDRERDRCQLVVTLIDTASLQPVAGATLAEASAESVLYATAGTWSDAVTETDVGGLGMLVNLEAAPWPGRLTSVAVSGSATGAFPLRAVSGAVAVMVVGVEP